MHTQHWRIDGLTELHRKYHSPTVTIVVNPSEPATVHVCFEEATPQTTADEAKRVTLDCVQFVHHETQYEIRCIFDGYTAHVRVFQDGKPANGFVYSVDLPAALDFKHWNGITAVAPLVESAKNDIVNCSWEKIQDFFGNNQSFAA